MDKCCDWEPIETKSELFPNLQIVFTFAFIIESIRAVNRAALMISSEQKESRGKLNFVGQQKTDRFNALLSPINIVT